MSRKKDEILINIISSIAEFRDAMGEQEAGKLRQFRKCHQCKFDLESQIGTYHTLREFVYQIGDTAGTRGHGLSLGSLRSSAHDS